MNSVIKPVLEFELINENGICGIVPERGTPVASGIDVFVPNGFVENHFNREMGDIKRYIIDPQSDVIIPLNIRVAIPEGYDLAVCNKSGVSTKKKLAHGAHIIDLDYRGVIMIHLFNFGKTPVEIKDGDKIAQLVMRPVVYPELKQVDKVSLNTTRCEGRMGSTGETK
jgi:dUTP pyrophosphatase